MKTGHSYLRWSSTEQSKGDSLERQIAARDRVCQQRGITLVEDYKDEGVSARRGKHRTKGNLAKLLNGLGTPEAVIKPGEYLLIENIDRLSRENPRKAWKHFEEIIDAGITIITTYNDREYSAKTIDSNPWQMHELLGEMQRAHSESDLKSQRIGDAWKRKRERAAKIGEKLSAITPAWLNAVRNDKGNIIGFKKNEDRVRVIRDIFDLAATGMGSWGIARILNNRKEPTFNEGTSWRSGYVGKIVLSQAVLGTYIPKKLVNGKREAQEPIEGYYGEGIVDPAVFARANMYREGRDSTEHARKRRNRTLANLFNERCFCDECGGVMRYKTYTGKKKDGGGRKPRKYLFCENNLLANGCGYTRKVNLDWIEETLLNHIPQFPLEDVINNQIRSEELKAVESKIGAALVKLENLEKQAAKAKRFAKEAETPEEEKDWLRDNRETLAKMKPVQAELATLRRKKSELETALSSRSAIRVTFEKLKADLDTTEEGDRFVLRSKLSTLLKTFIDQIRFHEEFITVILHGELVLYRFSLSRPGSAPKKNPMKLIGVVDQRPHIGPRELGGIDPKALTVTNQAVYAKLMKGVESNLLPVDPTKVKKRLGL